MDRSHPNWNATLVNQRHDESKEVLQTFQDAIATQPGFSKARLDNLPVVASVLDDYYQVMNQ